MFVGNISHRLQLDYDPPLNDQIGEIFAKTEFVSIIDAQRLLRLYVKTVFPKTMRKTIFIYLFQQARTKIGMQVIGNLSNSIYQSLYICIFHLFSILHFYTSTRLFPFSPFLHFYTANPTPIAS